MSELKIEIANVPACCGNCKHNDGYDYPVCGLSDKVDDARQWNNVCARHELDRVNYPDFKEETK